ncbi:MULTISPECIES: murein hydrolase activator EnvC family protein [Saccharibacillus]|uniref:murein hydrolase activator EnvC family protein n=1 Tax=Saccharibacillus TaxID=456492 RepID=UPI001238EF4D|nr:peptidoglycan DD-metalloendopeptidase family protein [Saccharibacillus sp. WB 17]MWJ33279.1 peptidoglycan DD-metalloendopeptidase family protein [Saccharibacillus sp. WB 17]
MKKTASVLAGLLLAAAIVQPASLHAASAPSTDKIDRQLQELQQKEKEAQAQKKSAESNKKKAEHYKNKTAEYLEQVLANIEAVGSKLTRVTVELSETEMQLQQTEQDLEAAKKRIAEREGLLDTRVRMMYTDGAVSYLDVLMASADFGDFLGRADSIKRIIGQDNTILEDHKRDQQIVIEKQADLETQHAKQKTLLAEVEAHKKELDSKEQEKRELIAKYELDIEEAGEISQEQDSMLVEFATKRSDLEREKREIEEARRRAAAEAALRVAQEKARQAAAAQQAEEQRLAEAEAAKAQAEVQAAQSPSSSDYSYNAESAPAPEATPDTGSTATPGSGLMLTPVDHYRMSSGFGTRVHPITGKIKKHTGVDMAAPQGTDIHAAEGGVVTVAQWWNGYGNTVVIDHGNGIWTLYGHIRDGGVMVSSGQTVQRGQKIAEIGSTGNSTGPHLHFEVRENGEPVNPGPYLGW